MCFAPHILSAQSPLKDQLRDKKTLSEIMHVVDVYYAGKPDNWKGENGNEPRHKQWKRWEWYMSGRLGPAGEFVDIRGRILKAQHQVEKMSPPETRDINPFWFSEGPGSTDGSGIGRADRIAFHPSNPAIFYIGTPAGGLWRTTNSGTTWTALTDHIPSTGISGIAVSWADPNDIYILTGDGDSDLLGGFVDQFNYERKSIGVLKSTDNGVTWKQSGVLDTIPFLAFKLVQDPTDANVLLAATDIGVFRTANGGSSWINVLSDNVYDLEFKPGTNRAFAASNTAVYYSVNGGQSWNPASFDVGLSGARRIELAVTPINTARVYLLVGDVDAAGTYDGTYRSTDSGVSYVQRGTTPNILGNASDGSDNNDQVEYDHCMTVSPVNSNIVLTGAVRIWKSIDGGQSYTNSASGTHADVHDLAYNPLDGNLYACTDGGVYVSDDDGATWTGLLDGFETSQLYHMAGTLLQNDYLLGGLQDNGVKLKNGAGSFWDHVQSNDGFDVSFYPNDETRFYATLNKRAYRYSDGGATNTDITPPGGDSGGDYDWFGTIAAHVSDSDYVFVGYDDVFVSDDRGSTWTNTGASGSWSLATCPSNANRLYAAGATTFNTSTSGTLWRTDNLGDDGWFALHNNPGFPPPNTISKITDIAVGPTNANVVYVTIGGFTPGVKVFRSFFAGAGWENYSGSLPDIPINCAAVGSGGDVYIGTDLGVFYRNSVMDDWMPFNNALPNVPVTDLFINENEGRIYASTFGRGTWRTEIATDCPVSLVLGGSMTGNFLYQASDLITSTTNVDGGVGTSVHFKAGGRVILSPGFAAELHTVFTAYIEACGSGGIPESVQSEFQVEND